MHLTSRRHDYFVHVGVYGIQGYSYVTRQLNIHVTSSLFGATSNFSKLIIAPSCPSKTGRSLN